MLFMNFDLEIKPSYTTIRTVFEWFYILHMDNNVVLWVTLTFTFCNPGQDTNRSGPRIWKCTPTLTDQLQLIRPNTASMLAIWQTLFVCLRGS